MGTTDGGEASSLATICAQGEEPKEDGLNTGNVYGSYVHGIFDGEGIAHTILQCLLEKKGYSMEEMETIQVDDYKEMQYKKLAAGIRESLDMKKVYEILKGTVMGNIKLREVLPGEIEKKSFEIIGEEMGPVELDPLEKPVIFRAIHTSADFDYLENLRFSKDVVAHGTEAIKKVLSL